MFHSTHDQKLLGLTVQTSRNPSQIPVPSHQSTLRPVQHILIIIRLILQKVHLFLQTPSQTRRFLQTHPPWPDEPSASNLSHNLRPKSKKKTCDHSKTSMSTLTQSTKKNPFKPNSSSFTSLKKPTTKAKNSTLSILSYPKYKLPKWMKKRPKGCLMIS